MLMIKKPSAPKYPIAEEQPKDFGVKNGLAS